MSKGVGWDDGTYKTADHQTGNYVFRNSNENDEYRLDRRLKLKSRWSNSGCVQEGNGKKGDDLESNNFNSRQLSPISTMNGTLTFRLRLAQPSPDDHRALLWVWPNLGDEKEDDDT